MTRLPMFEISKVFDEWAKADIKPILFKQCQGQVVYKDGTIEPIITYRVSQDQCEVRTATGQYKYVSYLRQHESGYNILNYFFVRFNHVLNDYDAIIDNIKEFQILGGDLTE